MQHDLAGTNIYECIHSEDNEEMFRILTLSADETAELRLLASSQTHSNLYNQDISLEFPRTFLLRMKCILAKRNAGITWKGYKVGAF